ncbi:MAG: AAA family ATPase [Dehalococcoidia bacterium]|nr:AAA family ATPase [Dehalococcoidia bacterium]
MVQVNDGKNGHLRRITTGVDALDQVLEGGVPQYAIVFIAGPPGTGKTVLCQQALFANARANGTSLYLATLSEPVFKMVRYVQEFSFFNANFVGNDVVYGDLGTALMRDGGPGVLAVLDALVKEHRPDFLVIDSYKVIREHFPTEREFREFTSELMVRLSAWEVTAFFVGEYSHEDIWDQPEFAIADGILYLYGTEEPHAQKRFLRVMKMRGTGYFSGEHFFDISRDGVTLYPRMNPNVIGAYEEPEGRIGSAIDGLAAMMGGGLPMGTALLIIGGAGSGKTLAALSLVIGEAQRGRPSLFVSFEEDASQLARNSLAFGWNLDRLKEQGLVEAYHVSPSELDLDRHAIIFKERAEAIGARCVVIDTITAMEASAHQPGKYQSYLWAIVDYFKRVGVTVAMTYESAAQTELPEAGVNHISFIADSIINTKLTTRDGELRRTLTVLKMRGSGHDKAVREYIIEPPRIAIGDVFHEPKEERSSELK